MDDGGWTTDDSSPCFRRGNLLPAKCALNRIPSFAAIPKAYGFEAATHRYFHGSLLSQG